MAHKSLWTLSTDNAQAHFNMCWNSAFYLKTGCLKKQTPDHLIIIKNIKSDQWWMAACGGKQKFHHGIMADGIEANGIRPS